MKLTKPLAVFDLETTGTWTEKDRIIEIGIVKCLPNGEQKTYLKKVNPQMPIPPYVTELTGISQDDVADAPVFKDIAVEVLDFIADADLGGFNVERFDFPLLNRELQEAGLQLNMNDRYIYDAQKIYHVHEKRDLTAAYKFYCQKDLEGAHSALVDTEATVEILKQQIQKYTEQDDVEGLKQFDYKKQDGFYDKERKFRWWNGRLYMMFGKYAKRLSLQDVAKKDPGYLEWMLGKDFSEEVKYLIENALKGQFPNPEEES